MHARTQTAHGYARPHARVLRTVRAGDVSGDGRADLYVHNSGTHSKLYINEGGYASMSVQACVRACVRACNSGAHVNLRQRRRMVSLVCTIL